MNEQQWRGAVDPEEMLSALEARDLASARKLRLFAVACCRRIWHVLPGPRLRETVETAERYADKLATKAELLLALKAGTAVERFGQSPTDMPLACAINAVEHSAYCRRTGHAVRSASWHAAWAYMLSQEHSEAAYRRERQCQAALLRDIFGNPFSAPPVIEPDWLGWNDGVVRRLAAAIYEERSFDRLPILADALEEAGAADPGLLQHLRGPGPHVLGCWCLDLLLGKE
jgi:hypothetical protein